MTQNSSVAPEKEKDILEGRCKPKKTMWVQKRKENFQAHCWRTQKYWRWTQLSLWWGSCWWRWWSRTHPGEWGRWSYWQNSVGAASKIWCVKLIDLSRATNHWALLLLHIKKYLRWIISIPSLILVRPSKVNIKLDCLKFMQFLAMSSPSSKNDL